MTLFDYFDRTAVIHLPERVDRIAALRKEISRVGRKDFSLVGIVIPEAPRPTDANGFASKGVYGNFLSHLGIIESAYNDGLDHVLILEDDAIFSREFGRSQDFMIEALKSGDWDLVFFGHSVRGQLPKSLNNLIRFRGDFIWAHCYAVHRAIMPRLISYLRGTIDLEKMYIDGALNEFRKANDDVVCLITSPCSSIQKGSSSSLAKRRFYDRTEIKFVLSLAREARDYFWKIGLLDVGPKRQDIKWIKIVEAAPWVTKPTSPATSDRYRSMPDQDRA